MGKCSHFPQTQTFVLLLSYLMPGEQREISHLETTSFTSRLLQEDGKVLQTGEKLDWGNISSDREDKAGRISSFGAQFTESH